MDNIFSSHPVDIAYVYHPIKTEQATSQHGYGESFVGCSHFYSTAILCLTSNPHPVSKLQTWRGQPTVLLLFHLQRWRSLWSL